MSDFIVGDIHGHYQTLMDTLESMQFDPTKDHLYSVGDLIDRGPRSLDCVRLLREEWFHAVRGNHEAMLLTYMGRLDSNYHNSRSMFLNGGEWFNFLTREEQDECTNLISAMPLLIETPNFHISHSFAVTREDLRYPDTVVWDRVEVFRSLDKDPSVPKKAMEYKEYKGKIYQFHEYDRTRTLWYVGHNTITNCPMFVNNQLILDTGSGTGGSLTVVRHEDVLEWLK